MIQLQNIVKSYGPHLILQGVSMQVKKGEVCVLLGPSGGGKSTLLRTINGLETFESGEIRVGEIVLPPTGAAGRESALTQIRQRVGMVFQQFHLFPHRTVIQNVMEAPVHVLRRPVEEVRTQAMALLERVGLGHKQDVYPGSLSGGQQQRVAIARTLAMNPQAILFDEPTSALDPRMTAEVTAVMSDLARDGQTMIVVTHGLGFARAVGHTVHLLHAGTIAESGTPGEIFENPQTDVTRAFLSDLHKA